jgi:hypothetical protein
LLLLIITLSAHTLAQKQQNKRQGGNGNSGVRRNNGGNGNSGVRRNNGGNGNSGVRRNNGGNGNSGVRRSNGGNTSVRKNNRFSGSRNNNGGNRNGNNFKRNGVKVPARYNNNQSKQSKGGENQRKNKGFGRRNKAPLTEEQKEIRRQKWKKRIEVAKKCIKVAHKVYKVAKTVATVASCLTPAGAGVRIGMMVGKHVLKKIAPHAKDLLLKHGKKCLKNMVNNPKFASKLGGAFNKFKAIHGKYSQYKEKFDKFAGGKIAKKLTAFSKGAKERIDGVMKKLPPKMQKVMKKKIEQMEKKFKSEVRNFKDKMIDKDSSRVKDTINVLEKQAEMES